MPYINQEDRDTYTERLDDLCLMLEECGWQPGAVTYVLFMIVARWFKNKPKYTTIASIRGCLIGTLGEFDSRYAIPYEREKINENGDVDLSYPPLESVLWDAYAHDCEVCTDTPADTTLEAPALVDIGDINGNS